MYIVRCVAAQRRNGNAQLQGAYEFKARDRTPGTRAWSAGRRSAHGDRRLQPVLVWRARRGGERIARWLLTILVVVLAFAIWRRFGSATLINRQTIVPSFRLTDLIFWGTIAFAWTGPEAASFMGGEIRNPQRCAALRLGIAWLIPVAVIAMILEIVGSVGVWRLRSYRPQMK